jgi:hypothetical protein
MSFWQPEHQALLDALRADDTVPTLVDRLTGGAYTATRDDARRWRGWGLALSESDAGARLIELRHARAEWPDAWERFETEGFTPLADHHSALLFRELTWRLADSGALDESARAWRRSLHAWARLERTHYLRDLGEHLTAGSDTDATPIIAQLLVPDVESFSAELKRALQIGADDFGAIDRSAAAWAWSCLDSTSALIGEDGDNQLVARARQSAMEAKAYAVASATTRFRRGVDAIDWAAGDTADITSPFVWLAQVCGIVEFRESIATTALKAMIDGAWTLRKIDRDDEAVFGALVEAGLPFAESVISRLDRGDAFGQGSRAADYLVFRGEQATDSAERVALFERALELSPGHRNASLLYSYELLIDVENWLAQIAANPAVITRVPLVGDSIGELVGRAWARLDEVERIYPYNTRLDDYRARVRAEAERLSVPLDDDTAGTDDA